MKYYTKGWYRLRNSIINLDRFKIIDNINLSDEEIEKLFKKEVKKKSQEFINGYHDFYATEEFDESKDLSYYGFFDRETKSMVYPQDKEEAKEWLERSNEDVSRFANLFKSADANQIEFMIHNILKMGDVVYSSQQLDLPVQIYDQLDFRLFISGYINQELFEILKKDQDERVNKLKRIEKNAKNALYRQHISKEKLSCLDFEECGINEIKFKDGNIYLDVESIDADGMLYGSSQYVFTNAKVITKDKDIVAGLMDEQGIMYNSTIIKYELYVLKDNRYEFHFLIEENNQVYCLTFDCDDFILNGLN